MSAAAAALVSARTTALVIASESMAVAAGKTGARVSYKSYYFST